MIDEDWIGTLTDRVTSFLETNHEVEVVRFIAFGSVVTEEFVPNESDFDVIVLVSGMDRPGDAFFMSQNVLQHVSAEGTPAVGVDAVVTPVDEKEKAVSMFEHTEPINQ